MSVESPNRAMPEMILVISVKLKSDRCFEVLPEQVIDEASGFFSYRSTCSFLPCLEVDEEEG